MKWLKKKAKKFKNWVKDPGLDVLIAGNTAGAVLTGVIGIGASIISGSWLFAAVAGVVVAADLIIKAGTVVQLIADVRSYI
jgi:hypothetical protein